MKKKGCEVILGRICYLFPCYSAPRHHWERNFPINPWMESNYSSSLLKGFLPDLLYCTVYSQTMREEGPMSFLLFSRTRLFLVLVLFQLWGDIASRHGHCTHLTAMGREQPEPHLLHFTKALESQDGRCCWKGVWNTWGNSLMGLLT